MARKKKLSTSLTITGDTTYTCLTNKDYTDSFAIEQDLTDAAAFINIAKFSKSAGSLTTANAKAIVIKNISNIGAEIAISTFDWKNSSDTDITNSVDVGGGGATRYRTWSFLLPANDFIYLPNSRVVSYSPSVGLTLESAANAGDGVISVEPKDINSGNEYAAISAAALLNEDQDIDETDITIDGAAAAADKWFKVDDKILIGSEVMRVVSTATNTLTVEKGLLGSISVAHSDDDVINYFFGNELLAFDVGKCMSDRHGRFSQKGAFFSKSRTADRLADGLVAGSIAIGPFYTEGGYLDWGLKGITATTETGLASGQEYSITLVVDEYNVGGIDSVSSETAIVFTTSASDTSFAGSSNAVLPKIQAAIDTQFYTTSSGLKGKKVSIGIVNGDVRVKSHSNHSDTRVGISVSASGTTPFDVGNFPARVSGDQPDLLGSSHGGSATDIIVYGPPSSLAPETIDDPVSSKTETNDKAFIFDDGNGNLKYMGNNVGIIDYEKGHCSWHIPELPEAEFKINGSSHSAHSGGISTITNGINTIAQIDARSVNTKENSKVQLILFG